MEIPNASAAALRWGIGVKIIAIGWLALLFSAWLHGEITVGFPYGAMASGVFWTLGSFLESVACEMQTYQHYRGCPGVRRGSKPARK